MPKSRLQNKDVLLGRYRELVLKLIVQIASTSLKRRSNSIKPLQYIENRILTVAKNVCIGKPIQKQAAVIWEWLTSLTIVDAFREFPREDTHGGVKLLRDFYCSSFLMCLTGGRMHP